MTGIDAQRAAVRGQFLDVEQRQPVRGEDASRRSRNEKYEKCSW